jgi:hypothetical protein
MNKNMNKNMSKNIIPGYKGVMDLDLTGVLDCNKKIIIEQHYQDIKNYNIEQDSLPSRLRYENTIERIQKQHDLENKIRKQKLLKHSEEQLKRDEMYNNSKKKQN